VKQLARLAALLVAAGLIVAVVYPLVESRPPVLPILLPFPEQARYERHIEREQAASILRSLPVFVFQSAIIGAIAFVGRRVLGVSLRRRPRQQSARLPE
jgi:hypothetical protein